MGLCDIVNSSQLVSTRVNRQLESTPSQLESTRVNSSQLSQHCDFSKEGTILTRIPYSKVFD